MMNTQELSRSARRWVGELLPTYAASQVAHRLTHPRRLDLRDWEKSGAIPAHRVHFRFGLSGLRWGERGPIVLALHGWEGRATQFRFIAEALVRRGYRLMALDAPAHGESPGHVSHPRLFAEALIEVAAEITAEAGAVDAVIGHSMGAGAAAYALAQGLSVQRAALIAGPSNFEDVVRAAVNHAGLGARATRQTLRQMEDRTGMAPSALDVAELTRRVEIPTLVVHDRDDAFVDFRHALRFVDGLPDARLHETNGLGHWRVLTDTSTVTRIADFLTHAATPNLALAA